MNTVDLDKIIVVGGGSAGLISALILKTTFSNKLVQVIKSEKVGIIGVGESTTEHISSFMRHVGISHQDLIKYCGATLKAGVYFQGFSPDDFMHHVSFPYTFKRNDYHLMYGQLIGYKKKKFNMYPEFFNYAEIPVNIFDTDQCPIHQYHIDTFKFNSYLLKLCKQRGIQVYEDEIKDIIFNDKGDVEKLISHNHPYEHRADLFVDCTGFKRLLAKRLNFEWVSYKKYLPLNSAVAFPTEETEEYNLFTLAKTMKSGWLWRIPTQTRTGNGYVFNKDFTSLNEIEKEIQSLYKENIKIERSFEFEPGYYKEMWKNNVVVAGLAGSFIEPLEATSIGSTIQQMFILIHFLPANDIKSNNKQYTYLMENIFNFVALHYQVKKDDSDFWKHIKNELPLTDYLKEYLPIWKKRLPQDGDFLGGWDMFRGANFINVLFGLDLLDLDAITKECRLHPFQERFNVTKRFRRQRNWEAQCLKISHKAYIDLLKNNKDKELQRKNEIY
tara:strand:+ start:1799 stop:3295 length:1497 start_codon:yes stop_codon:yes gene_type:complete